MNISPRVCRLPELAAAGVAARDGHPDFAQPFASALILVFALGCRFEPAARNCQGEW
jgi:hypothetical protein